MAHRPDPRPLPKILCRKSTRSQWTQTDWTQINQPEPLRIDLFEEDIESLIIAQHEGDQDNPRPRSPPKVLARKSTQTELTQTNEPEPTPVDLDEEKMTEKRFNEIVGFIKKPFGPDNSDPVTYYETLWKAWHDLWVVFDLGLRWNMGHANKTIKLANDCFPTYLELMERKLTYAHYMKCPTDCMVEAMKCCVLILTKTSKYLDPEYNEQGLDAEFLKKFDVRFPTLVNTLMDNIFNVTSVLACSIIDVFSAIGQFMYIRLPDGIEQKIIPFLMCVTNADARQASSQVKGRVGRCFGKYIEFPNYRTNFPLLLDILELCERFLSEGEVALKTSYAWTFATWTDIVVSDYSSRDGSFENGDLNIRILSVLLLYADLPMKAKYNIGRACFNIFSWMHLELLEIEVVRIAVRKLTVYLLSLIGSGQDYKLRWNCAYAVGGILGNRIFFHFLEDDVIDPIINELTKWMVNSQSFKERTQCANSLRKVTDKDVYGSRYALVWIRLCTSLAQLPIETNEGIQKFKSECILLFFHLINMLSVEDFPSINDAVVGNMQHLRSLVEDFAAAILMENMDEAVTAGDYIKDIEQSLELLPYESTASALTDIVKLALRLHRGARRPPYSS